MECEQCVLQWQYIAGNNWGICANGNGAVGCGDQEQFRACADVAIGKGSASVIPKIKPITEVQPYTEKWPSIVSDDNGNESDNNQDNEDTPSNEDSQSPSSTQSYLFGAIITVFTFFLVLFALIAICISYYHCNILKSILQRSSFRDDCSSSIISIASSSEPPVRPPRTKRITQTLKDIRLSNDKDSSLSTMSVC